MPGGCREFGKSQLGRGAGMGTARWAASEPHTGYCVYPHHQYRAEKPNASFINKCELIFNLQFHNCQDLNEKLLLDFCSICYLLLLARAQSSTNLLGFLSREPLWPQVIYHITHHTEPNVLLSCLCKGQLLQGTGLVLSCSISHRKQSLCYQSLMPVRQQKGDSIFFLQAGRETSLSKCYQNNKTFQ